MFDFLTEFAIRLSLGFMFAAAAIFLLTALELVLPRGAILPLRHRLRTIGFIAIFTVVTVIAAQGAAWLMRDWEPLFPALGVADALIAVLLFDLIYYWFHRAQHSIPWLWRIHSVHHSQALGAGAGYHHPVEAPLKTVFVLIPASLLFGGHSGLIVGAAMTLHGYYVHSTTRLNFGPFSWLLCDNRVHRIHHSTKPEHFDRNFGVVTLAWDRLFGTAYMPTAEEWPNAGLDHQPEAVNVRDYLHLRSHHPVKAHDTPINEPAG